MRDEIERALLALEDGSQLEDVVTDLFEADGGKDDLDRSFYWGQAGTSIFKWMDRQDERDKKRGMKKLAKRKKGGPISKDEIRKLVMGIREEKGSRKCSRHCCR